MGRGGTLPPLGPRAVSEIYKEARLVLFARFSSGSPYVTLFSFHLFFVCMSFHFMRLVFRSFGSGMFKN